MNFDRLGIFELCFDILHGDFSGEGKGTLDVSAMSF